jgi:hypothetical protein
MCYLCEGNAQGPSISYEVMSLHEQHVSVIVDLNQHDASQRKRGRIADLVRYRFGALGRIDGRIDSGSCIDRLRAELDCARRRNVLHQLTAGFGHVCAQRFMSVRDRHNR